ncbi:hypothetical protein BV25DRAFT_1995937 [Artomyces pyxidatus]|uniref:Uncharacterized protein n=1 Tax=Artomyces pyxidatus TaxID=48021 RepID=A0ACB8SHJ3_9AGAM|nr:hypothetical protein BV25DRAFT_1995937 [Artomyces pyxidatus]
MSTVLPPLPLPTELFLFSDIKSNRALISSDTTHVARRMLALPPPLSAPHPLPLDISPPPVSRSESRIPFANHPRRASICTSAELLAMPCIHESAAHIRAIPVQHRKRRFPLAESSLLLLKVATSNHAKQRGLVAQAQPQPPATEKPVSLPCPDEKFSDAAVDVFYSELKSSKRLPYPPTLSISSEHTLPTLTSSSTEEGVLQQQVKFKTASGFVKRFGGAVKRSCSWSQPLFKRASRPASWEGEKDQGARSDVLCG